MNDSIEFACSLCEGADTNLTCESCTAIVERVRESLGLHPCHAGQETWVIVQKHASGVPDLMKGVPMDPNITGRTQEGAPVSTGAYWDSEATATEALNRYITADVRDAYEVRRVIVYLTQE